MVIHQDNGDLKQRDFQTAYSPLFLEVRRVFNPKQARSQKVVVKRKETNLSRRSRPNFVTTVFLSSQKLLFRERRTVSSLRDVPDPGRGYQSTTWPMSVYKGTTESVKTWPSLGQNVPKIPTLSMTTTIVQRYLV